MRPQFDDKEPSSDRALGQALDFKFDEARIQRQIQDRIARIDRSTGFVNRLKAFAFAQPSRAAMVGILGAFLIGFGLPFEPTLSADGDLIRLALGDASFVLGLQETH